MRFVDYKCNDCSAVSELVIRSDNGTEFKCDNCGSSDMVRIFAPVGLRSSSSNGDSSSCSDSGSCSGTGGCSGGSCSSCSGCG